MWEYFLGEKRGVVNLICLKIWKKNNFFFGKNKVRKGKKVDILVKRVWFVCNFYVY